MDANPNYFRVRAVAITETLSVIVVERERAVGAGMDAERCRFDDLLRGKLPHRIERHDCSSADEERQCGEINFAFDPLPAFELFPGPPIEPRACRQINATRLHTFLDDRRDENIAAPEVFVAELYRFGGGCVVQPERAH